MVLRGPPWTKRCSPPALRGQTKLQPRKGFLRGPPWPSVDKKVFPPPPFADRPNYNPEKVFSVVLRGPPWTKRCPPCPSARPFTDQKGVLRGPPWPSVDKKVFPPPLRGQTLTTLKRCSPWPSVALRGQKGVSPCPSARPFNPDQKGVLRGPSVALRGQKGVSPPALRGQTKLQP